MPKRFPDDFAAVTLPLTGDEPLIAGNKRVTLTQVRDYVVGGGGAAAATVVWRANEPTPSDNVYATPENALAALAAVRGLATLVLDASLSTAFEIPAGTYPFACTELRFVGVGRPNINLPGVTFTGGSIRSLVFDACSVWWLGNATSLLGPITHELNLELVNVAQIYSDSSSSAAMFEIDFGAMVTLGGYGCQLNSNGYGLFDVAGDIWMGVIAGFYTSVSAGVFRGDGSVAVLYDSMQGSDVSNPQSALAGSYAAIDISSGSPLTSRVDALIAPTAVDENSPNVSWTVQKRIRHRYAAGVATYTLDAATHEWAVGESRELAQYSESFDGMSLAVPVGHKLNTITNGARAYLGAAPATDGVPLFTVTVTRESLTEWSWRASS